MALIEDPRKCWAYAETKEPKPWRIPREQWQIYNGEDWVAAPSDFSVTEAQSSEAPERSLPAGWERKTSRSTNQIYYFNTLVSATECHRAPCEHGWSVRLAAFCSSFVLPRRL